MAAERRLAAGEILFSKGEPARSMFVVEEGRLGVTITVSQTEVYRGEVRDGVPLIGETHVFSSGPRIATISAATDAVLWEIPSDAMRRAAEAAPELVTTMGEITRLRLRTVRLYVALQRLFPQIDEPTIQAIQARLDWVYLPPGERLFAQGDPSDAVYIALSGNLLAVAEGADRRVLNTIAPGELIGEIGFFTGEPRSASVYAARDCEVLRASRAVFEGFIEKYPPFLRFAIDTLIRRVKTKERASARVASGYTVRRSGAAREARLALPPREVRTIALVPAGDVPLARCVERLVEALATSGPALALDAARVEAMTGVRGIGQVPPDHPYAIHLASALEQAESASRFVLYVADPASSGWTRWCLRRADRVLVLASASSAPDASETEERLLGPDRSFLAPRQTLVLVRETGAAPEGTRRFLERRDADDHLHLAMDRPADFARLARALAGRTVGLVLSGGGARGCAHIGVLRALEEARVPIDVVGGTSIGAMVAALHARGLSPSEILDVNREMWIENRPFQKFTLPVASILSERRIDRLYRRFFGDQGIEDLPLPFFCVSSNLTRTGVVVHRDGPLWRAVRASSALPGIMVPSLEGGDLLVDGAMVDNLPVGLIRELGSGVTIGVSVGPVGGRELKRESFPSPLELLGERLLPAREREHVPGILEILARSALLSSAGAARAARDGCDLYLEPPVQGFRLLDFNALEALEEVGYRSAREALERSPKLSESL